MGCVKHSVMRMDLLLGIVEVELVIDEIIVVGEAIITTDRKSVV